MGVFPMSVFGAMNTAVTGMAAQSKALGNISDNIANSQTIGYKRVETSFQNLVTQSSSTNNNPGGVRALPMYMNNVQGPIQQSESATNIAISGNGFFQVSRGTDNGDGVSFENVPYYTRAGDFSLNRFGYLQNSAGYYLNGWGLNNDGSVNRGALQPISIQRLVDNPQPTSSITLAANLPLTPPANAALPGQEVSIVDTNGSERSVKLNWRQQGPDTWWLSVDAPDSQALPMAGTLPGVDDQQIDAPIVTQEGRAATPQVSTVTFGGPITASSEYSIQIGGKTYSCKAVTGSTEDPDAATKVAQQIYRQILATGTAPGGLELTGDTLTLTGDAAGNSFVISASPASAMTVDTPTPSVLGIKEEMLVTMAGTLGDIGDTYKIHLTDSEGNLLPDPYEYQTDGTETTIESIAQKLAGKINDDLNCGFTAVATPSGLQLTARVPSDTPLSTSLDPSTWTQPGEGNGVMPPHITAKFGPGGVLQSLNASKIALGNATVSPLQNPGDPAYVSFTVDYGHGPQTIQVKLGNFVTGSALTQQAGTAIETYTKTQDGFTRGSFQGIEINASGDVVANYDNGRNRVLGRIPVVQVDAPEAMARVDGSAFRMTRESGGFRVNDAGTAGGGSLSTSSLEGSNVDIAQEFTKLIVTQRAYSANTRIVTTSDEMLQETLGMKR